MAESAVNDVAHLVEVIYTRFILRDLIGKIVPGAIGLIGISVAIFGWPNVHGWMKQANGIEIILLTAVCWLSTICMQWLGEVGVPWVKYDWMVPRLRSGKEELLGERHFENSKKFETRRKQLNLFLRVAYPDHVAIYERFVVIREAAGNSSTALAIVLIADLVRHAVRLRWQVGSAINLGRKQHIALWICGLVAAYSLRAMYFEHKKRQEAYVDLTVEHLPTARA